MKKIILLLIVIFSLSSCANQRYHGVGNTTHAYKAKKYQQQRLQSQFTR
jgi:hypothetical protein